MNNALIIYDNEGYVISQMQGSVREPVGVPFMWVEVPEGKYVKRIDVTVDPHAPVFEDFPKSEIEQLKEENTQIKLALAELGQLIGEVMSNG